MPKKALKITTEKQYDLAVNKAKELMKKGASNITVAEGAQIKVFAEAISKYEDIHYPIEMPKTFSGMIELKMYELKLTQAELSKKLGIATSTVSKVLNGKSEPNVHFLKAAYEKLHIPADFILKTV